MLKRDKMNKFKNTLLVTDLDGTLLKNDKSISRKNSEAIEYFKSEGGIFTFVTGRIPGGATHLFEKVKPNAPCGCANGGCVYDYKEKKLLWHVDMPRTVFELVDYVDKNMPSVGIEICGYDKIFFYKMNDATETHRINEHFEDIRCHYNDVDDVIAKILFADNDETSILKLADILAAHPKAKDFDFIRSDKPYYEILPGGVNKGNVISKLSDITGVGIDRIVAVGDNDNDAPMLREAGVGIAVSNASPMAKSAADKITVSNEEDAIARVIEDIEKGRIFS